MHILERAHAYHRAWRYRLRTERQEIAYLLSRDLRGATVVDIGANRGIYSYWMHKAVAPDGNVVAFEPQPELAAYLRELKSALRLNRLTVVEAALSSSTGEGRLVRPRIHWGAGSLELEPAADRDALTVPTTTLDEYFLRSPLRPVRFIKADIQGHEHACFVGGERLLGEDRPTVLCESEDYALEPIRSYLTALDYDGFFFLRGHLTPVTQFARLRALIPAPYLNYVFLPREHAATA
jgi:FkbM family methyltransferase